MGSTTTPTVSERLIAGTLALIAQEGPRDLSVRRLAEASGRSTMCVYTYFKGRIPLLESAHRTAAADILATLDGASSPVAALREFAASKPALLLWLLSADGMTDLDTQRAEFARALIERLATENANLASEEVARIAGRALLDRLKNL